MLLSGSAQTIIAIVLSFAAIGLYCFTYIESSSHSILSQSFASNALESNHLLHPNDHIYREPHTISLTFNVTQGYRSPDGVRKQVYLINGEFPGPTIEARSGDELIVNVQNWLDSDDSIAIHWHGLSMRQANDMDGVSGLTQSGIPKYNSSTYRFRLEESQAGTFWYHAHSGAQRADGLFGALIVHKPVTSGKSEMASYGYEEEQVWLIGDWYHRSATEIMNWYTDWVNFGNEPAPDSLLINGDGHFNCSMAVPARPLVCGPSSPPQLVLKGKRSRIRVINVGALTGFTLSISGYGMTAFQLDGGNEIEVGGPSNSIGILYPGERMDILVERIHNAQRGLSTLSIELDPENMKFPNLALTPLQEFPILSTMIADTSLPPVTIPRTLDLAAAVGVVPLKENIPKIPDQVFVFYTKIEILSEFRNIPKGFINRTSWGIPEAESPPLVELESSSPLLENFYAPWVESGEDRWIDIVVNNQDDKSHPFHLHGYDFYVLSSHKAPIGSYDAYNPFDLGKEPKGGPMNTVNPPKKDTILVPRMGYVVLRIRANNDGLWFFHCHVLWHEAVGMAMAFRVGREPI